MPFPLSTKVVPAGSAPVMPTTASGVPIVVTVNVPAMPTTNVVVSALVMSAPCCTLSVKSAWHRAATPLLAVNVRACGPAAGRGRAAERRGAVAVVGEVTPAGSVPVSVIVGQRGAPRS